MLKRKKHQDEKEEGFIQKLFQRVKEISFYSYMLSMLIAVLLAICFSEAQKDKRNSAIKKTQTVVQTQIVPKEKFDKKEEINPTAKLNEANFEVFVSKKVPNRGLILIKPSDIISKKDKIVFSDSVNTVEISGNPEILRNIEWSLSTASKSIHTTPNSIKIELNSKENTVFSFNLRNLELLGEYLNSNSPLLSVTYTESYAE